ncbi:MAG TPA: ABC transporter substrate-binding protein [Pseudidiomarina sp.]|nr:ABC transporter substrate-binding protein [Pseudidiomarina sp.]
MRLFKNNKLVALITVFSLTLGVVTLTYASESERRLVVTGGTLTEIVFALGGGTHVVAVDSSSLYPLAATQLPQVGYYRSLAAEGVLAQRPSELWALAGTGSGQTLEQIAATGVQVRSFAKPETVAELYDLIAEVGAALQQEHVARELIVELQSDLAEIAKDIEQQPTTKQAIFVLQASERGVVVAGDQTVPHLLMQEAHVQNVVSHNGFKPVTLEFLALQQPDFLIAPAHVVQAAGGREAFCQAPTLQLIHAAQRCDLLVMDSLLALGMTPRLATAIRELSAYVR